MLQHFSHPLTLDARCTGFGTLGSADQLYLVCRFMKLEIKDYTAGDLTDLKRRSKLDMI